MSVFRMGRLGQSVAARRRSIHIVSVIGLLQACGGAPSAEPVAQPTPVAPQPLPPPAEPTAVADAPPPAPAPPPPPPAPPPPCPEGMIKIAGGSYKLGPLKRDVEVASLCVDVTEVTAGAYAKCVESGKCNDLNLDCADAKTYKIEGKENHPVVCVDHPQATAYCESVGKRLPTDAEWEWAARGGEAGNKYAWGSDAPKDQACWSGSSEGARTGTCEVGSISGGENPSGLKDITGNVFEWTASIADSKGTMYVGKGGSWRDGVANLMTVSRPGGFKPEYRCGFGGMRCVKAPLDAPPTDAAVSDTK